MTIMERPGLRSQRYRRFGAGFVVMAATTLVPTAPATAQDPPPDSIFLNGIVRDFEDSHPDFEAPNLNLPRKRYTAFLVEEGIDSKSKPILRWDGVGVPTGRIVRDNSPPKNTDGEYKDGLGQFISAQMYTNHFMAGDVEGEVDYPTDGYIESQASFHQWFNNTLFINIAMWVLIEAKRQDDGTFVFDSDVDEPYASLGGFFPIEDRGFGNPGTVYMPGRPLGGGADRNFHFTFEGHWQFVYDEDAGHFFSFTGDDDVWVFVNGEQVIDLGGRHSARTQTADMTRLGLVDDRIYRMDFFYAERHCCQSNMRIQTNMPLIPEPNGDVSEAFD